MLIVKLITDVAPHGVKVGQKLSERMDAKSWSTRLWYPWYTALKGLFTYKVVHVYSSGYADPCVKILTTHKTLVKSVSIWTYTNCPWWSTSLVCEKIFLKGKFCHNCDKYVLICLLCLCFDSYEKCESMLKQNKQTKNLFRFLGHYKCSKCQTLHDGITHWALPNQI